MTCQLTRVALALLLPAASIAMGCIGDDGTLHVWIGGVAVRISFI